MLGLITQSKLLRPWMQLSYGTHVSVAAVALQLPVRSNELKLKAEEVPMPRQEATVAAIPTRKAKRMSSRIPRMVKTPLEPDRRRGALPDPMMAKKEVPSPGKRLMAPSGGRKSNLPKLIVGPRAKPIAAANRAQLPSLGARVAALTEAREKIYRRKSVATAATGVGGGGKATTAVPLVRSTRTSRCRIMLAHASTNGKAAAAAAAPAAPVVAPVAATSNAGNSVEDTSGPQTYVERPPYNMINRKCLTEPLIHFLLQGLEGNRNPIWCFICSDQVEVNVPSQLIIHYSPLMRIRQKNSNLSFSKPIQLETISSDIMHRMVTWMQHHRRDNLRRLEDEVPLVTKRTRRDNCNWDTNILGNDIDVVLQVLLAANCLGIYQLVEHTMLYFIELIKRYNNAERMCMKDITKTLTELQHIHPISSKKLERIRLASQNGGDYGIPQLESD